LPFHNSNHPEYDNQIKRKFHKIQNDFKEAANKPHPDALENIEGILHATEDEAFKLIFDLGGNKRLT
jgi:hypothetical protein